MRPSAEMTMRTCLEPGCSTLVVPPATRCDRHRRAHDRRRNHAGLSRQARGYGPEYQRERASVLGTPCALRLRGCTGRATTAQHTDDGRLVGACAHCNYADGLARARAGATPRHARTRPRA